MAIYQNNDKFYFKGKVKQVDGSLKSYNRLAKGASSEEEAKQIENQFLMKAEMERYEVQDDSSITFKKLCELYFADRRNVKKSTTIQNDYFGLKKFVSLNEIPIVNIKPAMIQKVLDDMDKKGAESSYINKIRSVAHKIFAYALREDYITDNPVRKVAIVKRPDELLDEIHYWTYDQFKKFISCVDSENRNNYYCFFSFQYYMGCRKGEALALSWNDINFEASTVKINKTVAQQLKGITYKLTPPKTKNSVRTIKMPDKLNKLLQERYATLSKESDFNRNHFIFGDEKPLGLKYIGTLFKRYSIDAGLPTIRIHDLRHSHASFLINKGANIKAIAARLGDNVETVLGVYTHLFYETEDELVKIINDNCL